MLAAAGIFIGVMIRMIVPALRKWNEDKDAFKWKQRYTIATLIALMIAFITTAIGFMAYPIPQDVSTFTFLMGSIVYGFGLEAATIEGMEILVPASP